MTCSPLEVKSLHHWLVDSAANPFVQCAWVGQAGFLFRGNGLKVGIDLYLSDSLAKKYQGKEFPHQRMMEIPIRSEEMEDLEVLLCTHGHTDHMDKETLAPLYRNKTGPLLIAPRYELPRLLEMGLPPQRLLGLSEYETFNLSERLSIQAFPAAHETRQYDQWGNTKALGYLLDFGSLSFYHSGDTLAFPELEAAVAAAHVDVCMLPVNGRKDSLSQKGILGNLNPTEAGIFAHRVGASFLIPHHFGMFDFNTVDPEEIKHQLEAQGWEYGETYVLPHINTVYTFTKEQRSL